MPYVRTLIHTRILGPDSKRSIMNGHVIPKTPIAVDFWRVRKCPNARIFFLTHMHADHTVGLTSQWQHTIYCSPVSKQLLQHKFSISAGLICALEVNESHIIPLDKAGQETMTVTVIDANHCPGAVMYLFDGYFGRILYTGDFRYESMMLVNTPLTNISNIDVLYLDNTYNCSTFNFPTRSVAKTMVCDIICRHPEHDVVIGVHNIGKENLLEHIAKTLHVWIEVLPDHYETLCLLKQWNVFTTNSHVTSVRVVPMQHINKFIVKWWNKSRPTIAILPTALFFAAEIEKSVDMFVVPYSDHSSYSELEAFVKHVRPRSIVPIVHASPHAEYLKLRGVTNMCHFSCYLDKTVLKTFTVPATVAQRMRLNGQNSFLKRGFPSKKKTVQKLKRQKMGYEFTDMSPSKGKLESLMADDQEIQQSHDQSHHKDNLRCVGCDNSDEIKDELLLSNLSPVTRDTVVNNIGSLSPDLSSVTDENVVNNIGPSSTGKSMAKKTVDNIGPFSSGQSTAADKSVVKDTSGQSPNGFLLPINSSTPDGSVTDQLSSNLNGDVRTSAITCTKSLDCTPALTYRAAQMSRCEMSSAETHQGTSQEEMNKSLTRQPHVFGYSRTDTQRNVQDRCEHCNRSTLPAVKPTPLPVVGHQAVARTAKEVHTWCEKQSNASSHKKPCIGDNILTDTDRLMVIMGPALDDEIQRMVTGHSWHVHIK